MKRNLYLKEKFMRLSLMAATAVLLTVTGIVYKQSFLLIVPLYISLVVGFLQTKANRYAMLLGGFNSIIYTAAYIYLGLYASAAQAFFFSCLFQFASFILWNKNKYEQSTVFRRMSARARMFTAIGFMVAFFMVCFLLKKAGSAYQVLDSLASLLGALVSVLALFAFVEYVELSLLSGIVNILLNIATMAERPAQITYVIFSLYSFVCVLKSFIYIRQLYAKQQREDLEETKVI